MSRAFFAQVADALPGFLPPAHRDFQYRVGARNCKVWFASWHEHYEVQAIARAALRAAGIGGTAEALEIGFHAEHPRSDDNDGVLARIAASERAWRKKLGRDPVTGPFVGRREQSDRWRRVSELWDDPRLDEDGAVIEAAERLAAYIRVLEPLIARPPEGSCACWSATSGSSR